MNQHSGSATLPRDFRYFPRTPEPFCDNGDVEVPAAPRPRLRLKRRVASQFTAPTQQFLASVAAADVPIPSIEEPERDPLDLDIESENVLLAHAEADDKRMLHPGGRFLPPRTPAPDSEAFLAPSRYPDWTLDSSVSSLESTPDYESSRPSTSRSTQTNASSFSRLSHLSDGENCADLEPDSTEDVPSLQSQGTRGGKLRKAPWTRAMTEHLWSTYILYLQDPKVTPFRMAKHSLPPHGVLLRVAREARRSWRGSKVLAKDHTNGRKSGSMTPTGENSATYIQWPHTCAATRGHLRELCKLRIAKSKSECFMARSPTPFTQAAARHWNRRATSGRSFAFTTQDMSLSLAISTSDTMQPQGPLAQLASSRPNRPQESSSLGRPGRLLSPFQGEASFLERSRLGSPFNANSYGPSSSGSLAASLGLSSSMGRRRTHTVGTRRALQSPVRLSRMGTQKRRNTQSGDARRRPSISTDTWLNPAINAGTHQVQGETSPTVVECGSISSPRHEDIFIHKTPAKYLTASASMPGVGSDLAPPRLGSPFAESASSFSFPQRMHRQQPESVDLGVLGRPFATFQQMMDSSAGPIRNTSLEGRLAYIDQRLKELRERESSGRSRSPL